MCDVIASPKGRSNPLAHRETLAPDASAGVASGEITPRNDIVVGYNSRRHPIHLTREMSAEGAIPLCGTWYLVFLGEVPEWLNGTVSKTVVGLVSTEGSNPSLPARPKRVRRDVLFFPPRALIERMIFESLPPRQIKARPKGRVFVSTGKAKVPEECSDGGTGFAGR